MSTSYTIIPRLVLLTAFAVYLMVAILPSDVLSENPRLTVFISDLHMGVGRDLADRKKWHVLEDFRWQNEFALFLEELDRLGKGTTDLVLNGDTFELWQSLDLDCIYEKIDKNLGCTEKEALNRVQNVLQAHDKELQALSKFARSHKNQIIIIPGNHDAALLFPAVANAVRKKFSDYSVPSERVSLVLEGYWLSSPDKLIYAEHGHQIGNDTNKFRPWPRSCIDFITEGSENRSLPADCNAIKPNGRWSRHLQRPWGEQFVQVYYNRYEQQLPIIDNLAFEQDGLIYALDAKMLADIVSGSVDFLKFFLFNESWEQFQQVLVPPTSEDSSQMAVKWNITRIRKEIGDSFLVESLPEGNPRRSIIQIALARRTLSLGQLTDEEIGRLCDQRAAFRQVQWVNSQPLAIGECAREDPALGSILENFANLFREEHAVLRKHLQQTRQMLIDVRKIDPDYPFKLFVYSHTHRAKDKFRPLEGNWEPLVVNTGAWQRVVWDKQLDAIKKEKTGKENIREGKEEDEPVSKDKERKILGEIIPEDLPACYSVILVWPYSQTEDPIPQLCYWRQNEKGKWGFGKLCDGVWESCKSRE